ncbi:MAG: hypothetical protein FJ042_07415, partial [Candidatus Cloacimonetes bacterium]|nr:hypothetical protein [Candidatus Cloacimonadota bacterium]
MFRFIVIALMVLAVSSIAAELVFNEAWNYTDNPLGNSDGESSVNCVLELPGGDILSVGYKSSMYNGGYVEYPLVVRHTSTGEIVWGNVYVLSEIQASRTRAIYAKLLNNGEVFIGCTSLDNGWGAYKMTINPGTAQVSSHHLFYSVPVNYCANPATGTFHTYRNRGSGSSAYIEISQYSTTGQPMGDPVNVATVGTANSVKYLVACGDGGYLLAGSRGSDGLLVRFNSSMQIVWEETYSGDGMGTQMLNQAVQTSAGEIFAVGKDDGEGFILCATYTGNVVWQQVGGSGEYNGVCETADGNLAAVGAYATPHNPRNYLVLYTSSGEFLFTHSSFDHYGWYQSVAKAGTHGFVA